MIETGIDRWTRGDFETDVSLGYDLYECFCLCLKAALMWRALRLYHGLEVG